MFFVSYEWVGVRLYSGIILPHGVDFSFALVSPPPTTSTTSTATLSLFKHAKYPLKYYIQGFERHHRQGSSNPVGLVLLYELPVSSNQLFLYIG